MVSAVRPTPALKSSANFLPFWPNSDFSTSSTVYRVQQKQSYTRCHRKPRHHPLSTWHNSCNCEQVPNRCKAIFTSQDTGFERHCCSARHSYHALYQSQLLANLSPVWTPGAVEQAYLHFHAWGRTRRPNPVLVFLCCSTVFLRSRWIFAFGVLGLVCSVQAKKLAGKNVSKMTYFVSSGMQNLNSKTKSNVRQALLRMPPFSVPLVHRWLQHLP